MSTEQPSVFRTVAKSRVANPEIVKKRAESFADSAAEWTEQPHAQLYLPASPSPDPFHISAFPEQGQTAGYPSSIHTSSRQVQGFCLLFAVSFALIIAQIGGNI